MMARLDEIVPNYIHFTKVPDLNSWSERYKIRICGEVVLTNSYTYHVTKDLASLNLILFTRATLWVNKSLTLSISLCLLYWDIKTSKAGSLTGLAGYQVYYFSVVGGREARVDIDSRVQRVVKFQPGFGTDDNRRQPTTISLSR